MAKKDACYRKVKSRYKVWPSAYASGALTQCRKVGAANWGNKFTQKKAKGRAYAPLDELPSYLRDGVLMLDMMVDIPITDRNIDGIGQTVT